MSSPGGTLTGNMGMFDQTMSLLWVRNNIAAFGGDPNRGTIFGQSAGGGSSSLHMISPYSTGVYLNYVFNVPCNICGNSQAMFFVYGASA